jgi:hypothetical protein
MQGDSCGGWSICNEVIKCFQRKITLSQNVERISGLTFMPEPIILTASAIATLAFQKAIESGAGELAKKFTEAAITKMDELRQKIWNRLIGKHALAEEALKKAEAGDKDAIETVGTILGVEMLDLTFAKEVREIAQEINAGKLVDQSNMTMNVYDQAKGYQTKVEGGTAYIGEIHQHGNALKPDQK